MKRNIFLALTVIAVLVGATSCDKDFYQETELSFYRFTGDGRITIYDSSLVEVEQRESTLKLYHSLVYLVLGVEPVELAFAEGETGSRKIALAGEQYRDDLGHDFRATKNTVEYKFQYNHFSQIVRIQDFNIDDDDHVYVCIDELLLTAEIKTYKLVEEPFYQKADIIYTLTVPSSGIKVATTTQDIEIGTKPGNEPEDASDVSEDESEDE